MQLGSGHSAGTRSIRGLLAGLLAGGAVFAQDDTEDMLLYHVSEDVYTLDELRDQDSVTTLQGQSIEVDYNSQQEMLMLDGYAFVVDGDIAVNNGVVHVISLMKCCSRQMTPQRQQIPTRAVRVATQKMFKRMIASRLMSGKFFSNRDYQAVYLYIPPNFFKCI